MTEPNDILQNDTGSMVHAAIINVDELLSEAGAWLITSGLKIFLIIILTLVAVKAIQVIIDQLFRRLFKNHRDDAEIQKRADTLKSVIKNIAIISVAVVALITVLGILDIQIAPILTAAGVVGVAVGFGAQTLVRDLINGFFILLDDQIRVGDVVEIAGKSGLVECVTLRMTTLRDVAGNVHFVRNGEITVVTNMTKEYSRYVFDIGVAYRENVDEVIEVIKLIDEDMRRDPVYKNDILEPIEIFGLDKFGDSAIVIKARTKTRPIRQWAVGREFNRRIKMKFDALGIEIPYPHLTLYAGCDKQGKAASLNVNVSAPDERG